MRVGRKQEAFPDTPKEKLDCLGVWWVRVSSAEHWNMLLGCRIRRGEKGPGRRLLMLQATPRHACVFPSLLWEQPPPHFSPSRWSCNIHQLAFPFCLWGYWTTTAAEWSHTPPAPRPAEHLISTIREGDENWGDWKKPRLWGHPSFEGYSVIFRAGAPGASLLRGLMPRSSHELLPWFCSGWVQTRGMQCCTRQLCCHPWNCSGLFFSCLRPQAAVVWKGIVLRSFAPHLCRERQTYIFLGLPTYMLYPQA